MTTAPDSPRIDLNTALGTGLGTSMGTSMGAVLGSVLNNALTLQASSLGLHLLQCRQARARWYAASVWAERAHGLVAPRFMTTVAVAALVIALFNGLL